MPTHRRLVASGICAGLALASAGRAQNLIPNGHFDASIEGWARYYDPGPEPEFVADVDHVDYAGSGSALFSGLGPGGESNFMGTCITGLTPGAAYTVTGSVRFVTGAGADSVALLVEWHDSTLDCAGTLVGQDVTPEYSGEGGEVWAHLSNSTLVSPAGGHSARVMVFLFAPVPGQVRVDGVHLVAGSGFVAADGFEIGSAGRWLLFPPP